MKRWIAIAAIVGLVAGGAGWLAPAEARADVEPASWRAARIVPFPRSLEAPLPGETVARVVAARRSTARVRLGRAIGPLPWTQPAGRALLAALLRPAPGGSR